MLGDDEAGHDRTLAVTEEQRLLREGRPRCPVDMKCLLVSYCVRVRVGDNVTR